VALAHDGDEMANLPIKYAERAPSGRGPAVRARLDLRTGEIETWRQVTAAGQALMATAGGVLDKIRLAERSAELDTLKRQHKESFIALTEARRQIQDPVAGSELWTKYTEGIVSNPSKDDAVNRLYQSYLNTAMPQQQIQFNSLDRTLRINKLKAEASVNERFFLEQNDPIGYANLQAKLEAGEVQSPEQTQAKIGQFNEESTLTRALASIDDNPRLARELALSVDVGSENQTLKAQILSASNMAIKAEHKLAIQEWENRLFQAKRLNLDISDLIDEGLTGNIDGPFIDQERAFQLEKTKQASADFSIEKNRVSGILNKTIKGELSTKDDPAILSLLAEDGIVTTSQDGDDPKEIRLDTIVSPQRLADTLAPGAYIPGSVAKMIGHRVISNDPGAVVDAVLAYQYVSDKMPKQADAMLGRLDELAQMRLSYTSLTREDLVDEDAARETIKSDVGTIMELEIPDATAEQNITAMFGAPELEDVAVGFSIDHNWATNEAHDLIEKKLERKWRWRFWVPEQDAYQGEYDEITASMKSFYVDKALLKYKVLLGIGVPPNEAKDGAHEYAFSETMDVYRRTAWGDSVKFVQGVTIETDPNTGWNLSKAAAKAMGDAEQLDRVHKGTEPVWSDVHDAFILRYNSPPFSSVNVDDKLFTWHPDRGTVLVSPDKAQYAPGVPIGDTKAVKNYKIRQEVLRRVNSSDEIIEIRTDAEWEALPPGTWFRSPDGKVRAK